MIDHRPPRELWPDLIYTLPELAYAQPVNLAFELVDCHVMAGRGSAAAILFGPQRISYQELQAWVNRIGNGLRALGIAPGDRVMLRMPNRPEFVATWLAIQKIGAVAVATMPMLRERELAYIAEDAEVKAAVIATELLSEATHAFEGLAGAPQIISTAVTPGISGGHESNPAAAAGLTLNALTSSTSVELDPYPSGRDDPAIIAYTSGSTGVPKGACHSAVDILASADSYGRYILAPGADDIFGGHPTLAFTYGLGGLLVFPLRFGASTALVDRFSPEHLLEQVARHRMTLLFCAATTYKLMLQVANLETRFDLSTLRLCLSAGEPLPRPVYDEWTRRTGIELLDCLGSTEMFHVFVCPRPGAVKPGATGEAVPGYEVRVVDSELHEVARGTPGLLAVRGPTGCRYWRKPDRQREYVRRGWNIPNDVCVQDEDGYIWYQCRNDDLIICAGYKIAGPEVEAILLEHPAVLEVAVVASPDPVKGQIPKAFVVLKPHLTASEALVVELQEHVKRQLAPYKYPRHIAFVDALPKTETGKIRRVELREREREQRA